MRLSREQILAVTHLPAPIRYQHFVRQVADWETVWGLYLDGWALSADDMGKQVLPVWSAREYAEMLAVDDWANYRPSEIPLEKFLEEMLPDLCKREIAIGVAYTPNEEGVVVDPVQMKADILAEVEKY